MEKDSAFEANNFWYQFDSSSGILLVDLPSKVDIISVRNHYKTLETLTGCPEHLRVLLRAEKSVFRFKPNALPLFTLAAEAVVEKYKTVKEAILTSKPKETAVATLFSEISISNFEFRVFHTESAARKWLKA